MLMLSGSPKKLCNGVTRRELLQIGGISGLGLSSLQAAAPARSAPKARSCIFVFLFGSPPQHETFDPKPHAPREIQGEMSAISTSVPGLQIGEGLPLTAAIADRLTIVRSMTHEYPIHCCAYVMTGMPTYSIPLETAPRDPQHWPFIGSVVDYLDSRQRSQPASMPTSVGLPWRFCSRGTSSNQAGPYGAFLGNGFDPFWTDFQGRGTVVVPPLNADSQTEQVLDPHAGIDAAGHFTLADGCQLPCHPPDSMPADTCSAVSMPPAPLSTTPQKHSTGPLSSNARFHSSAHTAFATLSMSTANPTPPAPATA